MPKTPYTFQQALAKAEHYCAYQERCHQEVRQRLYAWGIYGDRAEEVITELITAGFLNEERFARSYAGGKFRMKKWGRLKIIQALQQKKVSPFCIEEGLQEIDEADYAETMETLAEKKISETTGNRFEIKTKTARYLQNKGYEPALIWRLLNEKLPT